MTARTHFFRFAPILVLAPLAARIAEKQFIWLAPYMGTITLWRFIIASTVIVIGLVCVHFWLPAGRRRIRDILPGIVFTVVGWVAGSTIFATYLEQFSTYVSTYAGLASIMIAVIFLYIVSVIFILGGELNAAIRRYREARARIGS